MYCYAKILLPLSLLLAAGCDKSVTPTPAQLAMQDILDQDETLGSDRNHASETRPLADAVREYVAAIDDLDFGSCPPAFTNAFRKHRDAWEATIPFFEQVPDMRGEMHDLFDALKADKKTQSQIEALDEKIWSTWREVEDAIQASSST